MSIHDAISLFVAFVFCSILVLKGISKVLIFSDLYGFILQLVAWFCTFVGGGIAGYICLKLLQKQTKCESSTNRLMHWMLGYPIRYVLLVSLVSSSFSINHQQIGNMLFWFGLLFAWILNYQILFSIGSGSENESS